MGKTQKKQTKQVKRLNHKEKLLLSLRNKFVYSTEDKVVHDRSCPGIVKAIPNEFFAMLEELPEPESDLKLAPCCRRTMLIREGMAPDCPQVNMQVLLDFFMDMRADNDLLQKLFCQYRAKFWYEHKDLYSFWVKEDMWRVERDAKGKLTLWHNNYYVNKQTMTRFFFNGNFHKQELREANPSFQYICAKMMHYSPQYHVDQAALTKALDAFKLPPQAYLHSILSNKDASAKPAKVVPPPIQVNVKHWEPGPSTEKQEKKRPKPVKTPQPKVKATAPIENEQWPASREKDQGTLRSILSGYK